MAHPVSRTSLETQKTEAQPDPHAAQLSNTTITGSRFPQSPPPHTITGSTSYHQPTPRPAPQGDFTFTPNRPLPDYNLIWGKPPSPAAVPPLRDYSLLWGRPPTPRPVAEPRGHATISENNSGTHTQTTAVFEEVIPPPQMNPPHMLPSTEHRSRPPQRSPAAHRPNKRLKTSTHEMIDFLEGLDIVDPLIQDGRPEACDPLGSLENIRLLFDFAGDREKREKIPPEDALDLGLAVTRGASLSLLRTRKLLFHEYYLIEHESRYNSQFLIGSDNLTLGTRSTDVDM